MSKPIGQNKKKDVSIDHIQIEEVLQVTDGVIFKKFWPVNPSTKREKNWR